MIFLKKVVASFILAPTCVMSLKTKKHPRNDFKNTVSSQTEIRLDSLYIFILLFKSWRIQKERIYIYIFIYLFEHNVNFLCTHVK